MRQQQYACNLRGIDVDVFKMNPVVLMAWRDDQVVGKATICWGKYSVIVDFKDEPPSTDLWTLGTRIASGFHDDGTPFKILMALSLIPIARDAS